MARSIQGHHIGERLERFRHWFRVLNCEERETQELLQQCLLEWFIGEPKHFRDFLAAFTKEMTQEKSATMALQYLDILSPLAEYFGMFVLKQKWDTYCFALAYPTEYHHIQTLLEKYKKGAKKHMSRMQRVVRSALNEFPCIIQGRLKEPYSIQRKLRHKRSKDVLALNDIFGLRIITQGDTNDDCFRILYTLHDAFSPNPAAFKDYISIPKTNGYQSLHTVLLHVLPNVDLPIEVQIRTEFMHQVSEEGFMSHWAHKQKSGKAQLSSNQKDFLAHISTISLLPAHHRHVYCLVNNKRLLKLPPKATVKDAANALGVSPKDIVCMHVTVECSDRVHIHNGDELQCVTLP